MIESNNADQLEEDKTFLDEEKKENRFHQEFCEDTHNTENDDMLEENEGCQFKMRKSNVEPIPQEKTLKGVSVQDAKNSGLKTSDRKQPVENRTLLNTNAALKAELEKLQGEKAEIESQITTAINNLYVI